LRLCGAFLAQLLRHQRRRRAPRIDGQLLQARSFCVVTGITHGRRRILPVFGCAVRLPEIPVGVAEVAQRRAFAVLLAALAVDRQRFLVEADGVRKPAQLSVGATQVS
jgi:hypothetical protein